MHNCDQRANAGRLDVLMAPTCHGSPPKTLVVPLLPLHLTTGTVATLMQTLETALVSFCAHPDSSAITRNAGVGLRTSQASLLKEQEWHVGETQIVPAKTILHQPGCSQITSDKWLQMQEPRPAIHGAEGQAPSKLHTWEMESGCIQPLGQRGFQVVRADGPNRWLSFLPA